METVQVPGSQEPIEIWPNDKTGGSIKGWMLYWATWALGSNGSFGNVKITKIKELIGQCFYFFGKVRDPKCAADNKKLGYDHGAFSNQDDDLSFYGTIKDIEVKRFNLGSLPEHRLIVVTICFDRLNGNCDVLQRYLVVDKNGDPDGAMIDSWWNLGEASYSNVIYFGAARFELD